jgi:two-component sensor histidine kinase
LLVEKEWLLKEVHHRVKNNLQIIMSLLNTQSKFLENDAAKQTIRDSQHRIQAISLIHQKLYQSENVSAIDMPVYIKELVDYLGNLFGARQRIRFELQNDPVKLEVSYAVRLGLILNEAITNGIKYAFPENREGMIKISLKQKGDEQYVMTIQDNGIGLSPDFENQQRNSLGMSLMEGLSNDIDGKFRIESNGGTTIVVAFFYKQITTRTDAFMFGPDNPSKIIYH